MVWNKKHLVKIVNAQKKQPEWIRLTGCLNIPIEDNSQHDALKFYEELVKYVVSVATMEQNFILHDSLKFQRTNVLFSTNYGNRVTYRTLLLQAKQSVKLELLLWNMAFC